MSPLSQSLTATGMSTALHLLLILLHIISTVDGDSYQQSWRAPESVIPMDEMKADCSTGELTDVTLSLQDVTENQCATQGMSFIPTYKLYLQDQITECFRDALCTQFYWSREGFVFGCNSATEEQLLRKSLQVIVTVTCEIPNTLHIYNIDSSTKINASRPVCEEGLNQRIEHIFTINHCPKDMAPLDKQRDGYEAWSSLHDLATAMEDCGERCPPIDTAAFKLQTLACLDQTEVKNVGIGVYWTCDPSAIRPLRTTSTTQSSVTAGTGSQTGTEAATGEKVAKYLVSLIVMSLLFVLCFCALIIVLVYFLYCKGKRMERKFTMPAGKRPPSKDTLYGKSRGSSQRKLLSSRTPSSASSERYVSEREHNSRNVELAKLNEDYAVPSVMVRFGDGEADSVIYENDDDDTYEVVDIEKPTMSPPQRTNTTQSGYTVMGKKPTRENSEKYSDGYLIPTAMRKSNDSS